MAERGGGVNRPQRGGGQEGTTGGGGCQTPALLTIRSCGSGRSWVRTGKLWRGEGALGFQLMMCES